MADIKREFGVIGLGRMGANLSLQALEKGMRVVGFDIKAVPDELLRQGLLRLVALKNFVRSCRHQGRFLSTSLQVQSLTVS